jgi:hypothetical protein
MYSSASTHKMRFEGLTSSTMPLKVWSLWATPKCKIFAYYQLEFGWRIDLKGANGKFVDVASYVTKFKNLLYISFQLVG